MSIADVFSKKNLLLAAGGVAFILLGIAAYKIIKEDPAKDTREAYKRGGFKSGGATSPTPLPVATPTPTPSPAPGSVGAVIGGGGTTANILPPGATPTPTPEAGRPGVIASTNQEVELVAAAPVVQKNIFTSFPPVPETIMTPTLPSRQGEGTSTNVQPIVRVTPSRFLFNNQSPEALTAAAYGGGSNTNTQYNPNAFAPMGETIQLAMAENATTENTEISVTAAVWEPLYFRGRKLLEVGDKLIGTAQPGKNRDRMVIKFNKIIFKDGKSMNVNATAQDVDGTYGVKGFVVGSKMLNSIAPVLLAAASSFTQTLQQQVLVPLNGGQGTTFTGLSGVSGAAAQTASAGTMVLPTAQNAGLAAGSTVFQKISELLAKDIEENKPYLLVPAGTRLQAFLNSPIDTSIAEYGK